MPCTKHSESFVIQNVQRREGKKVILMVIFENRISGKKEVCISGSNIKCGFK